MGATHDTMDADHMGRIAQAVRRGTCGHCPEGSHCALDDDQTAYVDGLIAFLSR